MSQSAKFGMIAAVAFLVFITSRGELPRYLAVLSGSKV